MSSDPLQVSRRAMKGLMVFLLSGVWLFSVSGSGYADEPDSRQRRYATREEQRDQGPKHEVTDWLTVSALIELEASRQKFDVRNSTSREYIDDSGRAIEGVFLVEPRPWLKAELVYEYDFKTGRDNLDEAIVTFEFSGLELEVGRFYMPFGEYFSHFVSGSMLEFGETRRPGLVVSRGFGEQFELSIFAMDSRAKSTGSRDSKPDWGFALQAAAFGFGEIGLSYLSDLAETDERLLADSNHRYAQRVDGLSAYLFMGHGPYEFTAELVQALDSYRELDADRNKPRAWNTELAWFPSETLGLALRLAGSRELEDAPDRQAGVALSWKIRDRLFLTVEALHGRFRPGLAEDDSGRELERVNQVGAQISLDL